MRAIRAAGAPLARIAAIGDGGGPAGPSRSGRVGGVAARRSVARSRRETGDVPDSTGGATGPGVEADVTAAEAEAAGCAASELADPESTTAREVLDSATGAGAGATAGAGSTAAAGGGCTTAGTGAGSTTAVGAARPPERAPAPRVEPAQTRRAVRARARSPEALDRRPVRAWDRLAVRAPAGLPRATHRSPVRARAQRGWDQNRRERGVNRCRPRIGRRGGGRIRCHRWGLIKQRHSGIDHERRCLIDRRGLSNRSERRIDRGRWQLGWRRINGPGRRGVGQGRLIRRPRRRGRRIRGAGTGSATGVASATAGARGHRIGDRHRISDAGSRGHRIGDRHRISDGGGRGHRIGDRHRISDAGASAVDRPARCGSTGAGSADGGGRIRHRSSIERPASTRVNLTTAGPSSKRSARRIRPGRDGGAAWSPDRRPAPESVDGREPWSPRSAHRRTGSATAGSRSDR